MFTLFSLHHLPAGAGKTRMHREWLSIHPFPHSLIDENIVRKKYEFPMKRF
jgi:hypothetical protein